MVIAIPLPEVFQKKWTCPPIIVHPDIAALLGDAVDGINIVSSEYVPPPERKGVVAMSDVSELIEAAYTAVAALMDAAYEMETSGSPLNTDYLKEAASALEEAAGRVEESGDY